MPKVGVAPYRGTDGGRGGGEKLKYANDGPFAGRCAVKQINDCVMAFHVTLADCMHNYVSQKRFSLVFVGSWV